VASTIPRPGGNDTETNSNSASRLAPTVTNRDGAANGDTSSASGPRSPSTVAATRSQATSRRGSSCFQTTTSVFASTVRPSCGWWSPNWTTRLPNTSVRSSYSSAAGFVVTTDETTFCDGVGRARTQATLYPSSIVAP
jgi:hypothetical protein